MMKKAKPIYYQGKTFIQLSGLPSNISVFLANKMSAGYDSAICFNGEMLEDCIEYGFYEYWLLMVSSKYSDHYFDSQI